MPEEVVRLYCDVPVSVAAEAVIELEKAPVLAERPPGKDCGGPKVFGALVNATGAWTGSDTQLQAKAPGLVHLIAGSPEYQLGSPIGRPASITGVFKLLKVPLPLLMYSCSSLSGRDMPG